MVFASSVFLVLRILRGVHYSLTTFFFGLYGSIECLILAAVAGTMELPVGSWDWFLAIVLAALTYIGQGEEIIQQIIIMPQVKVTGGATVIY